MAVRNLDCQLEDVIDVCRDVQRMLGPFGTNKLVIAGSGDVTITDSATVFLENLEVSDPMLTLVRTAAREFRERNGDGTGTVVTLTGALLSETIDLVETGVHPTSIERGYREALSVTDEAIGELSRPYEPRDGSALAGTALTGTRDPNVRSRVSEFVSNAAEEFDGRDDDPDVDVVTRLGTARSESELIHGVVLDADPVAQGMSRHVEGGIAILSGDVDVDALGTVTGRQNVSVRMETDSFESREAVAEAELTAFDDDLRSAIEAGCRCLFTSGAIADRVKTHLAAEGVLAVQQIDESERARLRRSIGAETVPTISEITEGTLGAGEVSIARKAGRDMTVVRGGKSGVYTLFCRAPDPRSVAAFERAVESAVSAVSRAAETGVVPGGGATEIAIARRVRSASSSRASREQLAMRAYANAVEAVPRTLARNAGLDATTTLSELRADHKAGDRVAGIDVTVGEVVNVESDAILEPAALKRDVFVEVTDLAVQLARVDEVLKASDLGDGDAGDEGPQVEGLDG